MEIKNGLLLINKYDLESLKNYDYFDEEALKSYFWIQWIEISSVEEVKFIGPLSEENKRIYDYVVSMINQLLQNNTTK